MTDGTKRDLLIFDQNCFSSDKVWENFCQLMSQKRSHLLVYLFTNFSKSVDLSLKLQQKFEDSKKLIKNDSTFKNINRLSSFLTSAPQKKDQILCSLISLILLEQKEIMPEFNDQKNDLPPELGKKTPFIIIGEENPFILSPSSITKFNINEVSFFGK